MKYKWLNKSDNKNLIVFFNGWGMDEKIVSHLDCTNYDVIMFYDYRDFEIPFFDFSLYSDKTLIAWSMGVYVCNYFYEVFKDFNKFIAINGTQKPVDDYYGIPVMIYNLTVENFNELSCQKFMKKITSEVNLQEYCSRSTEELKSELISIRDLGIKKNLEFDKVYLSTKDRIFPYKNMLNFWQTKNAEIKEVQSSHYIFGMFKKWEEIL